MWFQYFDDPGASPIPIDLDDVKHIMEMNARGEKPDDLQGYAIEVEAAPEDALYGDVVGQDDVGRFDSTGRRRRKGGRRRNRGTAGPAQAGGDPPRSGAQGGGKRRKKRRKGRGNGNAPQG